MSEVDTFKPLGTGVLVKVNKIKEEKEVGGIFIPTTAQDLPDTATVVAVGPGTYNFHGNLIPIPIKEGDTVYFAKYAGTEIKFDLDEYLLLRESDILGFISA